MKKIKKRVEKYHEAIEKKSLPINSILRHQDEQNTLNPPEEMRVISWEGGIHFGRDPFNSRRYIGKQQDRDGHVLVVGSPGCHKTTGVVLPTLLTWRGTFVAIDIKGDIMDFCLRHEDEIMFPVKIVDFANFGYKIALQIDPFLQLREGKKEDLVSNARELALTIIPTPHDLRDPFWIQEAQNILMSCILYAVGKGFTFNTMIHMIQHMTIEDIRKAIEGSENENAKSFINQFPITKSSISDDKILISCFMEMKNHVVDFFHENVKSVFNSSGNVFDLKEDIDSNNLIIRIPESKLKQWGSAVRLILRQLFSALSSRPEKYGYSDCPPFLLLWDEMPRFGKFEELTEAFSTLRSRGVTICATIQSFAQLDDVYGISARCTLVDCCSYIIIGAVKDVKTQRYCSEMVGSSFKWELGLGENYSLDRGELTLSRNLNRCREPLIYPEDFSNLSEFIAITPFGKFRIEKAPIFEKNYLSSFEASNSPGKSTLKDDIVNYMEIFTADIARSDKKNSFFSSVPTQDESVKTNIDFRRSLQLGQILVKFFPDLQRFQPKLNQDSNAVEFKPFEDFLTKILKYKPVREAWEKMLENKQSLQNSSSSENNG